MADETGQAESETALLLDAAGSAPHREPGVLVDHVLDRLLADGDRMGDVVVLAGQRTG
jgi:hypothetical protein